MATTIQFEKAKTYSTKFIAIEFNDVRKNDTLGIKPTTENGKVLTYFINSTDTSADKPKLKNELFVRMWDSDIVEEDTIPDFKVISYELYIDQEQNGKFNKIANVLKCTENDLSSKDLTRYDYWLKEDTYNVLTSNKRLAYTSLSNLKISLRILHESGKDGASNCRLQLVVEAPMIRYNLCR